LAALDRALLALKAHGCPMDRIVAISGSGQQHGSVYWRRGSAQRWTAEMDHSRSLDEVIDSTWFSRQLAPIWMDNSTTDQCREISAALGGAQSLAELTGSSAYERFTGPQIRRFYATEPQAYADTERISLVSSFIASALVGGYAPIDWGDASGMNLLDIHQRTWSQAALDATAPELGARLGAPVAPSTVVGAPSIYAQRRFGFADSCRVVVCSGDNLCSSAGLRVVEGSCAVSLGTSDTMFAVTRHPSPLADAGHVFCSATDAETYLALLCFKNGSLVREGVRDRLCGGSWVRFNELLRQSPPGNGGNVGFFYFDPEILPRNASGEHRFNGAGERVTQFADAATEVRALVESQFLSMRHHAAQLGVVSGVKTLIVTGGASQNRAIVQIAADVFGVPAYAADSTDSAAVGAAYRALYGVRVGAAFCDVVSHVHGVELIATPDPAAHAVYSQLLSRFGTLLKTTFN
jgi:xylulokinase